MSARRSAGLPVVHFVPVEAVQHVAGDAVLLQHHGDGLRGVDRSDRPGRRSRCRWRAPASVDRRGRGNRRPGRRACRGRRGSRGRWPASGRGRCIGLSTYIVCRQGASKPVSHMSRTITMRNGSLAVLEAVRQLAALVLVADVRLPVGAVVGAAGHHDLHDAVLPSRLRRRRPGALAQSGRSSMIAL